MLRAQDGRRRVAAVAACLLVALAGVCAFVTSAGAVDSPWDVTVPPLDQAKLTSDPLWLKQQAEGLAARAAEERRMTSPAADGARLASRTAFDDLSRAESTELAQQTFPELMIAPLGGLDLPEGLRVQSFLGKDVVRVKNSEGKQSLVIGSQPLAAPDEETGGKLAAVDLSLSTKDGKLVPDNPAVDVALPDSASDALQLPDTGLNLAMADAADVAGQVDEDRVFYGDVSADTDYITMARPAGAQVLWQLRSPQATEEPSLELGLPEGVHARLTSALTAPLTGSAADTAPSVEIVRDDGTVLDTIAAPMAADADGQPVPASYRLDGDRLVVDVPHRNQQVRYPVMVDPEVHEVWGGSDWDNFGKGACNCNMAGLWSLWTNGPYVPYNSVLAGRGLWIDSPPGFYYQGQSANFSWTSPPYVSILSAWFDGLYHVTQGDHIYFGTWGAGRWTNVSNIWGDDSYNQYTAIPDSVQTGAQAILGVYEDQTVQHPIHGWAGVRGVNIRVGDGIAPGVRLARLDTAAGTNAVNQTSWLSSSDVLSASVVGGDVGLGLQHVGIMTMDNNWIGNSALHVNCNGSRGAPCPLDTTWNGPLSLASFNGYATMRTVAIDITGNAGFGPAWTLKVDGSNPFVGFGGEAWDHRSDGTLGYNPTLRVVATDGDDAHPSSGVRLVGLSLDGKSIWSKANPAGQCPADSCPITQDVTLPITSPGNHVIQASTYDYVGHAVQTDAITINVVGDAPGLPEDAGRDEVGTPSPVADGTYGDPGAIDACTDGPCDTTPVASEAAHTSMVWGIHDMTLAGLGGFAGPSACTTGPADARMTALLKTPSTAGVSAARLIVPYDIALNAPADGSPCGLTPEQRDLQGWLNDVKALGLEPLISFEHISYRTDGFNNTLDANGNPIKNPLPTDDQYRAGVRAFLARYKSTYNLTHFTAWNEPNNLTQPTRRWKSKPAGWSSSVAAPSTTTAFGAAMAGRYWRILRAECSGCVVGAGDFIDRSDFNFTGDWGKTYVKYLLKSPTVWAFHPYGGMKIGSISSLKEFMRSTAPANVWVTEVGPIFNSANPQGALYTPSPDPNAVKNRYTDWMDGIGSLGSRLTRVYLYQFKGGKTWETGLIAPGDLPETDARAAARGAVRCNFQARVGAAPC
jgi:hypothetical protein